jgi:hypothetical protein
VHLADYDGSWTCGRRGHYSLLPLIDHRSSFMLFIVPNMCSISSFWFLFHPSQYSDILAPLFTLSSLFFIAITSPWCHMLPGFIHNHAVDAPTVFRLNSSAPRCLCDLTMTSWFRQVLGPARLYALSWHLPSSRPLLMMRVHDSAPQLAVCEISHCPSLQSSLLLAGHRS